MEYGIQVFHGSPREAISLASWAAPVQGPPFLLGYRSCSLRPRRLMAVINSLPSPAHIVSVLGTVSSCLLASPALREASDTDITSQIKELPRSLREVRVPGLLAGVLLLFSP